MTESIQLKLGSGDFDSQTPVRYPNVFTQEMLPGGSRLIVGPADHHIEVLLSLAEVWAQDYYLLYVLLVPRASERAPGRYQSPGPLSFQQVAAFCRKFSPFFQGDARHHLWIGSTTNAGLLVYDHHEWLYAYGDVSKYTDILRHQGFREGDIVLPSPHSHRFHATFDESEDRLMSYWDWAYYPLQPGDNE